MHRCHLCDHAYNYNVIRYFEGLPICFPCFLDIHDTAPGDKRFNGLRIEFICDLGRVAIQPI